MFTTWHRTENDNLGWYVYKEIIGSHATGEEVLKQLAGISTA